MRPYLRGSYPLKKLKDVAAATETFGEVTAADLEVAEAATSESEADAVETK